MRWTPRLSLHEEALPGAMKKVLTHALGEVSGAKGKASGQKQAKGV
jgi:A/G-specific adenine glycosylase